ncbi:hypothetical protein N7510_000644 [Penicillium lagena]|uniref:uncharacterized protein n=1 Tax=Penicillium lagena TaxID=94218 RepID=UPI0025410DEB|nr:uncharacterized protein N7510_000644 [Penicillium lagena]KAJ5624335.1 hypothetical protein N7510_000644 [Penicillium lagena]
MPQTDVLVVGAGPTGLVLALWLHKQGVNFHIIDQAEAPAKNSRALVIHSRILELYRQLDLTDEILQHGHKLSATNLWVDRYHRAHIPLEQFGSDLTPYPFLTILPQDDHERLLEKRLNSLGIFVERCTRLLDFVDHGPSVTANLLSETDGSKATWDAAYIVGCDGARSAVRHGIHAKYEGDTYEPLFYIADIDGEDGPLFNGEAHLSLTRDQFLLLLPYSQKRHVRLVGTTLSKDGSLDEHKDQQQQVTVDDVLPQIKQVLDVEAIKVNWFSTYRSHHRVADKFRANRAFIIGDAAHIHSPVGGQGMNTGIMDAMNLAWKLATVLKQSSMTEESKDQLLGSYEYERRAFALKLVESTDRGFTVMSSNGWIPYILRRWVLPYVAPLIPYFPSAGKEIFRTGSQLILSYRGSSLSQAAGGFGAIQPGDRLPWAKTKQGDNFSSIQDITWQVHVYGDSRPDIVEWCTRRNIQLFVFDWDKQHGKVGLQKDAAYLLRPDHYIAGILAGEVMESQLDEYFSSRGLTC